MGKLKYCQRRSSTLTVLKKTYFQIRGKQLTDEALKFFPTRGISVRKRALQGVVVSLTKKKYSKRTKSKKKKNGQFSPKTSRIFQTPENTVAPNVERERFGSTTPA